MTAPRDPRAVLAEVVAHEPGDERERWSCRRTAALLTWLADPFDPDDDPCHVTGSAIVLDGEGRVALHRHKRLGRWLQPGGHLEPGEAPLHAAVRETREETGLDADASGGLLHVDVHEGPRGHVHLDLRYLLTVDGSDELVPEPGESPEVAWWPVDRALAVADASLAGAIRAATRRLEREGRPWR